MEGPASGAVNFTDTSVSAFGVTKKSDGATLTQASTGRKLTRSGTRTLPINRNFAASALPTTTRLQDPSSRKDTPETLQTVNNTATPT
ncbi:MAG: hypothetical protein ACM3UY_04950 [Methanocella sp.]